MGRTEQADIRRGDRVIEIAPPNLDLADWCHSQGVSYLGLVPPDRCAATAISDPDDRARLLAPLNSIDEISANNADVLVLHPPYHRLVWQRRVGNVRIVATPARGVAGIECLLATALVRRHRTVRRRWGRRRYRAVPQARDLNRSARHYLSSAIGVAGLPDRLDEQRVSYAVLRWFDALPHVDPGEDLDILVADQDLPALLEVLESAPGTIPCDIYSETGLPGSDYHSIAYYPPRVAAELLAATERHTSGYRVPDPRAHFRSLAFHAVYHKGERSGLPSTTTGITPADRPEHDYAGTLAALARHDDYVGEIDMETLDQHLANVGWRPARDALARLAERNEWLRRRHFAAAAGPQVTDDGALAVFLLRERAAEHGLPITEQVFAAHGFEILAAQPLDHDARLRCSQEMRGGNWGPGPYPISGGEPAIVIVALDRQPRRPSRAQLDRFPALANANIHAAKLAVRDAILEGVTDTEHYNPIHSSDCELDAWEYVDMAMPTHAATLRSVVAARRDEVAPPAPADTDIAGDDTADGDEAPVAERARRRRRARSLALLLPRRARSFLAYRLGRWRLAGLLDRPTAS